MNQCFNCGENARWQDHQTGAFRCVSCVIAHGGGRPHSCLPQPVDAEAPADGNDQAAVEPDPMDVWDELQAGWDEADLTDVPEAVQALVESMLEEGKMQAMAPRRRSEGVPQ